MRERRKKGEKEKNTRKINGKVQYKEERKRVGTIEKSEKEKLYNRMGKCMIK